MSKLLNALGLIAVDLVLVLAFVDQLWLHDLPCPLCILQRAAFIAAGFGLALNLLFGPRPSHYGVLILGAAAGAALSIRQILLHIVPGTGAYGNPMLGLHLYTWAFLIFALMIVGTAILLFNDRQFGRPEPWSSRLSPLPLTAFVLFALVVVGNILSTLLICGLGFCPDNPTQYLLFGGAPA
ncbi:MAG TPA: disulfide bond formation protein B [Methyloceanibacter sp.]|nr:disulfide bond formation protein B [Methyloceanibacter sp.]